MSPSLSVLVPWRTDHGQRERVWDRIRPLWTASGFELCVGTPDDGPFNAAQAFNRAAEVATGDVFVTMGADHWPDLDHIRASAQQAARAGWTPLYDSVAYLSPAATEAVVNGVDPASLTPERTDVACTGVLAVTRHAWQDMGGMDERYAGWGFEDAALRRELIRRYGDVTAPSRMLVELWHPTDHRDLTLANPNRVLFESAQ